MVLKGQKITRTPLRSNFNPLKMHVCLEWQIVARESQDNWVRSELGCRARGKQTRHQDTEAASQLSSLLSPASAAQPRAGDSATLPHALWTDIKVTWLLLSPGPNLELVTDINIGLRQPLGGDGVACLLLSAHWILSTWTVFTDWLTLVLSGSDNVVQSLLATDGAAENLLATPDTCHTGHSAMTGVRWANTFMMRIMWKECIYWFWTGFHICSNTANKVFTCILW